MILPIQRGDNDMGDVADGENRIARFVVTQNNLSLLFIRINFTDGSGAADLVLYLDKQSNKVIPRTKFELLEWSSVGVLNQVHTRITLDERDAWQFMEGDELVFEWTNPDPGIMLWAIEVGLTGSNQL